MIPNRNRYNVGKVINNGCSRWVPPKKEGIGICVDGFPVTAGCRPGKLGRRFATKVHCIDEEWCGKMYFFNGGKPYKSKEE